MLPTQVKPRVLVVDDDPGILETAACILRPTCCVITAQDAEQGLARLTEDVFDVLLCDIRLPGMNGLELLKIAHQRWPSTSVIMMSVIDDVTTAVEAMRLGAYFYTTKTFEWEALVNLVLSASARQDNAEVQALRRECLWLRREVVDLRSPDDDDQPATR